jgi:hypothetical protein
MACGKLSRSWFPQTKFKKFKMGILQYVGNTN